MSDIPNIPAISTQVTPEEVRRSLNTIRVWFDAMRKGGGLLSAQQLENKINSLNTGSSGTTGDDSQNDTITPAAPTGLVATGGFNAIFLSWGTPNYTGHSYTKVYRAEINDLGQAVYIGESFSSFYTDTPPNNRLSKTYYYWIRHVSITQTDGPFNSSSGTPGSTADEPGYILDILSNEITEGELFADLNSRINLIDAPNTGLVDRVTANENEISSNISSISALMTSVGVNAAAISTEQTARINADDSIEAKYTVKVDVNGYVTGYGLIATENEGTPTSEFAVLVDRFWVASPGHTTKIPFVISNGSIYIDIALIEDATITNAKIKNLAADKITTGFLNTDRLEAGFITAASGFIADAAITTAKIADAAITNAKIGDLAVTDAMIQSLDGGKITANTITASQIATNAITTETINGSAVTVHAGFSYTSMSGTRSLSISSVSGGKVAVHFSAFWDDPGDGAGVGIILRRNGSERYRKNYQGVSSSARADIDVNLLYLDTPGSGTHTYSVEVSGAQHLEKPTMVLTSFKR